MSFVYNFTGNTQKYTLMVQHTAVYSSYMILVYLKTHQTINMCINSTQGWDVVLCGVLGFGASVKLVCNSASFEAGKPLHTRV